MSEESSAPVTASLPTSPPTRPSYNTTEFWLTSLAVILSQLYASGAIGDGSAIGKVTALVASLLGAIGYTVMRTKAKV